MNTTMKGDRETGRYVELSFISYVTAAVRSELAVRSAQTP